MGSFVDSLDLAGTDGSEDYWTFEREANGFAADLLIPADWLSDLIAKKTSLADCRKKVIERCDVSPHAASIPLTKFLPGNIVFAIVRNGRVEHSGRTEGTFATALTEIVLFESLHPRMPEKYFVAEVEK